MNEFFSRFETKNMLFRITLLILSMNKLFSRVETNNTSTAVIEILNSFTYLILELKVTRNFKYLFSFFTKAFYVFPLLSTNYVVKSFFE